eukprot:1177739-Prorocentrum_minimum.AAC.2
MESSLELCLALRCTGAGFPPADACAHPPPLDCSWDLSGVELKGRVGHLIATNTLLIMSGADEYVPPYLDHRAIAEKLAGAMGAQAVSSLTPAIHCQTVCPLVVY